MKKTVSIVAIALMMAGSMAYACSGCGCEAKKSGKERSECGKSCGSEKQQTACHHSQKGDKGDKGAGEKTA